MAHYDLIIRGGTLHDGTGSEPRVADIAVTLVRLESDRLWMLAERPQADYLMNWLKHAGAALEP